MGETMTFEKLYNHMETYIKDPDERWKLVTRVKRGISDPNAIGCYSRDQAYFEGAVKILENIDNIDFTLLMSGKLCLDELDLVKSISKLENIKLPKFFADMNKYKQKLRQIALVNGIIESKHSAVCIQNFLNKQQNPEQNTKANNDMINRHLNDSYLKKVNIDEYTDFDHFYQGDLNEYQWLYEHNKKFLDLDPQYIKNYIVNFIIPNTHNKPVKKQAKNVDESNSSLCSIL